MKLFHKLLIVMLPVSLFYLLGFWLSIYTTTTDYVEEKLENDLEDIAALRIKEINTWVAHTRERLESFNSRLLVRKILAQHPDGKFPSKELNQLKKIVTQTQYMVGGFDAMYLLLSDGSIAYSTIENLSGTPFVGFRQLMHHDSKISLATPLEENDTGYILQNAIQLILDNELVGFLVVKTRADSLQKSLNSNVGLGEHGKLLLLAESNEGTKIPLLKHQKDEFIPSAISTGQYQSNMSFEYSDADGNSFIALPENIDSVNWTLLLSIPKGQAYGVIHAIRYVGIAGVGIAAILMVFSLIYIAKLLSRPIENLASQASELHSSKKEAHFALSGVAEYDKLSATLNAMMSELLAEKHNLETNVELRTGALTEKNNELKRTLDELKSTQNLLIETEKMAALGEMVAGVAHEVNTPIGSALGAATYLMETSKTVQLHYEKGELTEEEFESLLSTNQFSTEIVVSNLTRAGDLVRSFKRVAVDQSNEKILEFDLVEYIRDVLVSLRPRFKHMKLEFEFGGLESVKISQIPGNIAQIVTNLVINAVVHGFENQPNGKIRFNISDHSEDKIKLDIQDNGQGMTEEVVKKLFEPFFTTKRNEGGTGLGLNIVYNLVLKNLKGNITVTSEIEKGAMFTIVIPRHHQVLLN